MAEEVYRIDVTVQVQDKYSNELKGAERTVSRFEQRIKRTEQQLDRMNRGRWRLMLSAVDRASHVINRVGMFADRVAKRSYRIAIQAVDMFTSPVRSMLSSMSGILATAGIAGGTAGGLVIPLKLQIERQNIEAAFEVLLGSRQAAQQRVSELIEFAGQTPYTRDEIFQASRVLEVFTRGALSTGEGLKLVGDVAAGTQNDLENTAFWFGRLYDALESGRPVGEMLMRLQEIGALTGEGRARIEELAKSGQDITRIWPEVTKEFARFDGMMERMSQNLGNLLLSVKSFWTNNIMMRWGKGLDSVLSPLLTDFRNWRKENSDLIETMGDSIEQAGRKFAGFFDTVFRGVGRNFDELIRLPEFQEADLIGKIQIAWDKIITQPLTEWWESGGQDEVSRIMGNVGQFIGRSLNSMIMTALGLAGVEGSDTGSVYKDIGTTAGRSFLEGFLEGFDANEVAKKLWEAFKNIQPSFLGGQTQSLGGTIMALMFDAWLITQITNLFRGPGRIGRGLFRGARSVFRGGRTVLSDTIGWGRDTRRGGSPGPLSGSPLLPGIFRMPKLPGRDTWSRIKDLFRGGPKGPGGPPLIPALGFAGGRIPVVGPFLNLMSLASTPQDQMPSAIGSIGGGIAGSMAGAALGSAVPGVGTAIGGIAGGILGSIGGEWVAEKISELASKVDLTAIKDKFAEGFAEAKEAAIEKLSSLGDSIPEAIGFVTGYIYETLSSLPEMASEFFGGLYNNTLEWISQVPDTVIEYVSETVQGIDEWWAGLPDKIGEWWSEIYSEISGKAKAAYDAVVEWIGGIPGYISGIIEGAKEWGSSIIRRITSGFGRGREAAAKYADGGLITRPHLGLVGEAGPEMIIPLSAARRNRALELWMQTAKYLGVRQYADGGITSPTAPVEPVSTSKGGAVNINVNVGGVSVQISTEKIDTTNKEETAEEIAFEISRKLQEILGNMPIVNTN